MSNETIKLGKMLQDVFDYLENLVEEQYNETN